MPRARSLKPGFFKNDELAETSFAARLLFAGLWTLADRSGRLEDRPKKIKMEIFPADDVDVDGELNALTAHGFILRYDAGGTRYIQVVNFGKHQTPHIKEPASTIPAPDMPDASAVQDEGVNEAIPVVTNDSPRTYAAPVKHGTRTGQTPDEHPLTPDSGLLITDSGLRIPDSGGAGGADAPAVEVPPDPGNRSEPRVPPPTTPFGLLEVLCDEIGQDPSVLSKTDKGKQLAGGKRLVESGIGERELRKMIHWLAPQPWIVNGGGLDLVLIAGQVGKWRLNGEPDGMPARASPNGRRDIGLTNEELDARIALGEARQ